MSMQLERARPGPEIYRYTRGRASVLFYYAAALVAVGAFLQFVYVDERARDFFARLSVARDERRTMLIGVSAIWLAIFADFVMQIRAYRLERPALILDARGVRGLHGGLWREIEWDELYEVEVAENHIRFVREPRNPVTKFFFRLDGGSGRFRLGEYAIHVLLNRIDGGKNDILRVIRRHRPDLL
ncbi:MAG: hypothetical protein AB7F96_07755 [Beijerinckiaceae bacterium]